VSHEHVSALLIAEVDHAEAVGMTEGVVCVAARVKDLKFRLNHI
jgi:hypothetical protein